MTASNPKDMKPASKKWEDLVWSPRGGTSFTKRLILSPLLCASFLYGGAARARELAYETGRLESTQVDARVIVVGNLTVGGVGKTPLVAAIARELRERGLGPAIISRGYKGKSKGAAIVSNGSEILLGPKEAGDEPFLLARKLPGVPVIIGAKRTLAARLAVSSFGAQYLVLDDGFGHLALQRDLDILVVDAERDPSDEYLLPRGPRREPMSAVARAGMVVVSRSHSPEPPPWPWLDRFRAGPSLFLSRPRPLGITREIGSNEAVLAFCAIGSPEAFARTLEEAGLKVTGMVSFRDHHAYTERELMELTRRAESSGAAAVVTTEKDMVKIDPAWTGGFPLAALAIELDFFGKENEFFSRMLDMVEDKEEVI